MKGLKQLGIWMDYSDALLMELYNHMIISRKILNQSLKLASDDLIDLEDNSEKQEESQSSYYKEIGEIIRNYQDILLFGPSNAKNELVAFLKKDRHFKHTKFTIQDTEEMADNEVRNYVVSYFE